MKIKNEFLANIDAECTTFFYMNSIKHILWDWNGTLLDDVDSCIEVINTMLSKRGLPIFKNKSEYRQAFCFPVVNYYVAAGFDFSKEPFEVLAEEYIALYQKQKPCLYDTTETVLKNISKKGITQYIFTASKKEELLRQISMYKSIVPYFKQLITSDNILASGKFESAKAWLEQSKANPNEVLVIGDTLHEKEIADKLNFNCALVLGGHQDLSGIKKKVLVLKNIEQILDII